MQPGQPVEVFNLFSGSWTGGFEIAEIVDGAYRLRRTSDQATLPVLCRPVDVRPVAA